MSIEEDINQKKFSSKIEKAHINIMYTANWLQGLSKGVLKPSGITIQQYNVLRILKGSYPKYCTAGYIKEVMLDKSPDLTRLIDRLIEKKLVTRNVCEENRRQLDISITKNGIALLKELAPIMKKDLEVLNSITDKEAIELSRILDKLRG